MKVQALTHVFLRLGILAAVVGSWGCISTPRTTDGATPPRITDYLLAPPDLLQVIVRGVDPQIDREVAVRPDGKISFDLIGEVEVLGKSVAAVQAEISERLREFIVAPDVTVLLKESNSRRYFVFGEVARIGAYPLVGDVTAVEALASAGGATYLAQPNGAWLSRPGGENGTVYRVRFDDITQQGDGSTNYTLQPGDVIYVPPGVSAQIGDFLRALFYPLQQIVGLGGRAVNPGRL